jgi:hypothetical protein
MAATTSLCSRTAHNVQRVCVKVVSTKRLAFPDTNVRENTGLSRQEAVELAAREYTEGSALICGAKITTRHDDDDEEEEVGEGARG